MRIRKLEMMGFKSFSDRTVVQFGDGVSCIVGPNGCGKSNIIDALRWCIGEQSAKKLRGSEMMDVIFAGSTDRKAVGYAEVAMTLCADDGKPFPGEYQEFGQISVGRRLHRSGQSEYFVNQSIVRRRDVVDLFLDTGIGNNLYSFIEQGRIGEIVQARPEQRRGLIDEAAGIAKYKIRRDEAQKRLESTATQLDRAADVADEMGRRVRTLARQVLKAADFRRTRALIRQNEIALSLAKYANLAAERRTLRNELRDARNTVARIEREIARKGKDIDERKVEIAVVEEGVDQLRDTLAEKDATLRAQESAQGFMNQREASLTEQRGRLHSDQNSALEDCAHAESLLLSTENNLTEVSQAQRERKVLLESVRATAVEQERAVAQLLDAMRQAEMAFLEEQARVEALAASRAADQERLAWLPKEIERCSTILKELKQEEVSRQAVLAQKKQDALEAERQLQLWEKRRAVCQTEAALKQESVRKAGESLGGVRNGLADHRRVMQETRATLHHEVQSAREKERYIQANQQKERRIWMRSVLEESRTRLSLAREEVEEAQQQQLERLRQWTEAQSTHWFREMQRCSEGRQSERDVLRRNLEEASSVEHQNVHTRFENQISTLQQTYDVEEQAIKDALLQTESALKGCRTERSQRVEQHSECTETLAQVRARLDAFTQADSDTMSSEDIETAIGAPSFVFEDMDAEGLAAYLPALNDRVALPIVVSEQQILTLHAQTSACGPVRVLWSSSKGSSVEAVLDAVAVVDSLEDALREFKKTGRAVVVRDSGDRISEDGIVELGFHGREGAALLRLADDRRQLQEQVREVQERYDDCMQRLAACDAEIGTHEEKIQALRLEIETRSRKFTLHMQELRTASQVARNQVEKDNAGRIAAALETFDKESESIIRKLRTRIDTEQERMDARRRVLVHEGSEHVRGIVEGIEKDEDALVRHAEEESERRAKALLREAEREVSRAEVELSDWERGATTKADRLEETLEEHRNHLAIAQSELADHMAVMASIDTDRTSASFQVRVLQDETSNIHRETEHASMRAAEILVRKEELASELKERTSAESALEKEKSSDERLLSLKVSLEHAESSHAVSLAALKETTDQRTQCTIDLAKLAERCAALGAQGDAASQMKEKAKQRLLDVQQQVAKTADALTQLETERKTLDRTISEEKKIRSSVWDKLQRERERLQERKTALDSMQSEVRDAESRRNQAQSDLAEHERCVQETQGRIEALRQRMDERYQVSLTGLLDRLEAQGKLEIVPPDTVLADVEIEGKLIEAVSVVVMRTSWLADADRIQTMVSDLEGYRAELSRIGEVNLMALDEYEDVRQRHAELETQRSDLEASIQRIRAAIAKMNRTCREQFRETFDEVNEAFQDMYPALVGGGRARLSLTNEDDLLETGVDIFVQPPGKRLQNLNLLSGGEKAMAAIGLIMALFKVKPSPFCVLDEVDAPLDEGNGTRFNAAIRQMSKHSQFILVTHNRKTMECADTLLGITMPVPGVSKLVSVNLDA